FEVDVAGDAALRQRVDPDVDHDRARLQHVAGHEVRAADGDDDDVRALRVGAQVARPDVADGHGREVVQQEYRDRLPDDLAVADDHRLRTLQIDAGLLDQVQGRGGGARDELRLAVEDRPHVRGIHALDV